MSTVLERSVELAAGRLQMKLMERANQESATLGSREWWEGVNDGENSVRRLLDETLARIMGLNLDLANQGEKIGMEAILEALTRLQREARRRLADPADPELPQDWKPADVVADRARENRG